MVLSYSNFTNLPVKNMLKPKIILDALTSEWYLAYWSLPQEYQQRMSRPQFAVVKDLKCWGQWIGGAAKRIELQETLLTRHPWYAVVDVLRHEMAHQFVECVHGKNRETPHGPLFQQACKLLRARPDASGNFPPLDRVVFSDNEDEAAMQEGAVTPQARLLVKIRKLLSLTDSPNQAEAEAALLKAREIAARYDLDLQQATGAAPEKQFYTIALGDQHARIPVHESILANILNDYFNVRAIWQDVHRLGTPMIKLYRQLYISGTKKDLQIASYVYDALKSYIHKATYDLPARLLGRVLTSKRSQQDFATGVLVGFKSVLQEQNRRPEMQALVQSSHEAIAGYVEWLYPKLERSRTRSTTKDPETLAAGEAAGKQFRLNPGLNKPSPKALPPNQNP